MTRAATPGRRLLPFSFSDRRVQWGTVTALAAVVLAWCALTDFRLYWRSWATAGGVVALLSVVGAYYRHLRELPDDRIPETLDATAVLVAYTAVAAAFSYLLTSLGRPPIDAALARWDAALGFDWAASFRAVRARPALAGLLDVLYSSLLAQVAIATVALGLLGRARAVREMMGLLISTSLVIVVLSGLLPAESAWVHHDLGRELAYHMAHFSGLRDGSLRELAPADAVGLVTFPSFHTAMSLIIVYACRGLRWLFWPVAAVNVGVLASIPVFGGHYLVDMLAGAAITLAATLWTRRADARRAATGGGLTPQPGDGS